MFKKQKLTEIQKKTIQMSNCYNCGFRIPLNNNPIACLWGIRDSCWDKNSKLCSKPHCDRYVCDRKLEAHIKSLLHVPPSMENSDSIGGKNENTCD